MDEKKPEWENVFYEVTQEFQCSEITKRLKVEGGYLYKHETKYYNSIDIAICFVPDIPKTYYVATKDDGTTQIF